MATSKSVDDCYHLESVIHLLVAKEPKGMSFLLVAPEIQPVGLFGYPVVGLIPYFYLTATQTLQPFSLAVPALAVSVLPFLESQDVLLLF